jgi:hypothetical protein
VLNFDCSPALHLLFCVIVVLRCLHCSSSSLSFVDCIVLRYRSPALHLLLFIIGVLRCFVLIALCYCPVHGYYLIPSSKMARPINPDDLLGNKLGWVKL